jgi:FkbM family methyltransferase
MASVESEPMLRRLSPSYVVDVGANRGQFALTVLRATPRAQIVSIEPIPQDAATFRDIFGPIPDVELVECALGSSGGSAVLYMSAASDSSSLLELGALQEAVFPGTGEVSTIVVPVTTLDEVLNGRVLPTDSLLKIDVQGFELEVLRGAQQRLGDFRWILVEVSFLQLYRNQSLAHEVFAYLQPMGFAIVDIGEPVRIAGRTVQLDVLFERVWTTDPA